MSFGQLGVVALSAYLLGLIAVAEIANRRRKDKSLGDHFLAGRELGVFVLFLTLYATAYSGNSLLGYPGRAYVSGFSFVMATGFMMSIIVVFHALVPKLRPIPTHCASGWGRTSPALPACSRSTSCRMSSSPAPPERVSRRASTPSCRPS